MAEKNPPTVADSPASPASAGKMPPRRRPVLDYAGPRAASRLSRRERIVDFVKTMAWVVPMTLLIWIYAERADDYSDHEPKFCTIGFQATGDRIVMIEESGNGSLSQKKVLITLEGPHSGVDAVTDALTNAAADRPPVEITLGADYGERAQTLENLRSLINANPLFVRNGVTVKTCQPTSLKVKIEKTQEARVKVQCDLPDNVNLTGPAVIEPATVLVRGPQSYLDEKNGLHVVADLKGYTELQQDGTHHLTNIPIHWYEKTETVEFGVDRVTVTIQTSQPSKIDTIPSILVSANMPLGIQKDDEVHCDEVSVKNVQIKGPPGLVDELVKDTYTPKPWAVLDITEDDVDKPARDRAVRIEGLPPGVTVLDKPEQHMVKFTVVKRKTDGT